MSVSDLPTLAIALAYGFGAQSGLIAAWRYYKRQRDEQDRLRRHIEDLEHQLWRERRRLPPGG
ncbi:MAG TPA: LapA family protein [Pseudonocardiaceae bacterium]|jgi:hypothetical protein|nr:LapA family protein [Pseudonocardiaceae bacterium]